MFFFIFEADIPKLQIALNLSEVNRIIRIFDIRHYSDSFRKSIETCNPFLIEAREIAEALNRLDQNPNIQ